MVDKGSPGGSVTSESSFDGGIDDRSSRINDRQADEEWVSDASTNTSNQDLELEGLSPIHSALQEISSDEEDVHRTLAFPSEALPSSDDEDPDPRDPSRAVNESVNQSSNRSHDFGDPQLKNCRKLSKHLLERGFPVVELEDVDIDESSR